MSLPWTDAPRMRRDFIAYYDRATLDCSIYDTDRCVRTIPGHGLRWVCLAMGIVQEVEMPSHYYEVDDYEAAQ